jgi:hypothetical protein
MTKLAAIDGQLVSIKNVSTHKSVCLTLHVPEEYALKVIEVFGWPTMAAPVPVAIAKLDLNAKSKPVENAADKKKWSEVPIVQKAGILCSEGAFRRFLNEEYRCAAQEMEDVAAALRDLCNVSSRKELATNPEAAERFYNLESRYRAWMVAA